MTELVQYTGEFTILEGKKEDFKRVFHAFLEFFQYREPGMDAYQIYMNPEENKAYVLAWFKDSGAVANHIANLGPVLPDLKAIASLTRLEIFGNLTKETQEAAKSIGATFFQYHEGFIREEPAPSIEVPDEVVGAWEHGTIDFVLWENYPEGHYAGRDAIPSREAMIMEKDGKAKFYRYEFALGLYEELIDCTGTVTFYEDKTFSFIPTQGRKRFFDTVHSNHKDRALTEEELTSPKIAGKRGYSYNGSTDPPTIQITVPGSAPYNWYKKTE
ncbi:MAG: hypothetical protein M3Q05_11560 [Bacteroidota bacterium]|nr:hypothetical protein [Bacteroidota bacterium]